MAQLSSWLSTLQSSELVLLIDEYDAPLTHCLDKPELFEEVRATMSELFLTLKSHEGRLRFFFMTGITKLSNTSIFSAFNNLQDISLDPFYGALLGYTEDEISKYFFVLYCTGGPSSSGESRQSSLRAQRATTTAFHLTKERVTTSIVHGLFLTS